MKGSEERGKGAEKGKRGGGWEEKGWRCGQEWLTY